LVADLVELEGRPVDAAQLADFVVDLWSVHLLASGLGASLALTLRNKQGTVQASANNEHAEQARHKSREVS
jgi:hypothetical protein